MKRIILVICSILLFGCSAQTTVIDSGVFTWVSHNGTAIEFPDDWQITSDVLFDHHVLIEDDYGLFYIIWGSLIPYDSMEYIASETMEEMDIEGDYRLFATRAPVNDLYKYKPYELFEDISEGIEYFAFMPNETLLSLFSPEIPELDIRLNHLIDALNTAYTIYPLDDLYKVHFFYGGLTSVIFPSDWEAIPMGTSPFVRRTNFDTNVQFYIGTLGYYRLGFRDDENVTEEDIIDYFMEFWLRGDLSEAEDLSRDGHLVYKLNDTFALLLNNEVLIYVTPSYRAEPYSEDEAIVIQMIDSILLNSRDSYYEPIELVLP